MPIMAGDWIKWTKGLPDKPEVLRMSGALKLSRAEIVVRLMRFWEWCDENIGSESIAENGCAVMQMSPHDGDNCAFIDSLVWTPGFSESLKSVGWLNCSEGRIGLPNFGRHNGKTAKTRARNSKTQKQKREGEGEPNKPKSSPNHESTVTEMSPRDGDKKVTREEERRDLENPYPAVPGEGAAKPRERNALFDAIVEVTGVDDSIRSHAKTVGIKAAELAKAKPPYTPDEVREFGRRYHEFCSWARDKGRDRPSPGELVKWISLLRAKKKPPQPAPNLKPFDPMEGHDYEVELRKGAKK